MSNVVPASNISGSENYWMAMLEGHTHTHAHAHTDLKVCGNNFDVILTNSIRKGWHVKKFLIFNPWQQKVTKTSLEDNCWLSGFTNAFNGIFCLCTYLKFFFCWTSRRFLLAARSFGKKRLDFVYNIRLLSANKLSYGTGFHKQANVL